jgi:hypothetical protein
MLLGKGGYYMITVYLNTFSQHMWAFKYKMVGTVRITIEVLSTITVKAPRGLVHNMCRRGSAEAAL